MAVLGTNNLTLLDWGKRIDPKGSVAAIAEMLSQTNEILTDAVWKKGNLPTGERVVIRTGLPAVYWRALNAGVLPSKSTTAQVDEACGILEAYSNIDIDLASLNGNTNAFRLSEDMPFIEAMNQQLVSTMFYGNPAADPKTFLGLSARYGSLSAGNAANILDGKASSPTSGALCSIWLICWGDNSVYGIFPDGSKAGLLHENLGRVSQNNSDGTLQEVYRSRFQWKAGIVLKDWRYAVRICNLEVANLRTVGSGTEQAATSTTNILHQMVKALYRIPNPNAGRCAFYCNRTAHSALSRIAMDKSASALSIQQGLTQFGSPHSWLSLLGVPIRQCDGLLNTETTVT